MLSQFLPTGPIWEGDNLNQIFDSFDVELNRIEVRAQNLVVESNPQTTVEMLVAKETEAGLPDKCVGAFGSISTRQLALLAKWRMTGGATAAYLIDAAATQGFTITIESNPPEIHHFNVHAPTVATTLFRAGESVAGDELGAWGDSRLECLILRLKPAHTNAVFIYDL